VDSTSQNVGKEILAPGDSPGVEPVDVMSEVSLVKEVSKPRGLLSEEPTQAYTFDSGILVDPLLSLEAKRLVVRRANTFTGVDA
jgi:hypothetical protein